MNDSKVELQLVSPQNSSLQSSNRHELGITLQAILVYQHSGSEPSSYALTSAHRLPALAFIHPNCSAHCLYSIPLHCALLASASSASIFWNALLLLQ